ncbi:MAG: hypothetical protein AB7H66_00750 [Hyphomonadaceae bacterium]
MESKCPIFGICYGMQSAIYIITRALPRSPTSFCLIKD